MHFNNFYISGNGNECPLQVSSLLIYFSCDVNMTCHIHRIDKLRQRLLHVWRGFEQSLTDDTVDRWPTRLHACVHANGEHSGHTLWLSICFLCTLRILPTAWCET